MENNTLTLEEYKNVMITYEGMVRADCYGTMKKEVVTRRAFYTKSSGYYDSKDNWIDTPDGYFHVPKKWQEFMFIDGTTALLPHSFYHLGRVLPKDIMGLKDCK